MHLKGGTQGIPRQISARRWHRKITGTKLFRKEIARARVLDPVARISVRVYTIADDIALCYL